MPPKIDIISVPNATFMVLIAEFPHQDLFGSVFGFPFLPDMVWFWFRHVILCLALVSVSVPPATDKASVLSRWLRYVNFLMLDFPLRKKARWSHTSLTHRSPLLFSLRKPILR